MPTKTLTKDQVKKIVDGRPAGTQPADIVQGLLSRGYTLEGFTPPSPTPSPQPSPSPTPGRSGINDWLSTIGAIGGSIVGGVGGSLIEPGAGTVIGGAIGAGIGGASGEREAQRASKEPKNLKKVAGAGGVNAVLDLIGSGVGYGAESLIKGTGKALESQGEKLALKPLRANSSQIRRFAQEAYGKPLNKVTGDELVKFIQKNGLYHSGQEAINHADEVLGNLYDEYEQAASKSGKAISATDVKNAFSREIDTLRRSAPETARIAANKLESEMYNTLHTLFGATRESFSRLAEKANIDPKYIAQTLGHLPEKQAVDKVGLDELVNVRRQYDESARGFVGGQVENINKQVRDILKGVIDKASGETATVGQKIREMEAYRSIALKQSGLGKGTQLLGLGKLLGANIGGGSLGGILGGVPGALAGIAATSLVNAPETAGVAAKALTQTGEKLANKTISPLGKILTKIGVQLAGQVGRDWNK